ncbi:MAG: NAD(P)-dependent oxidoreductase, partial [Ignavibacteriaceae bacterium]|nr:NAD(P)-dependent oxidoreductase [Ignavibacteriaceae bacterium]
FGMNIIGYDPVLSEDVAAKIGAKLVDLEAVFAQSDIITVHVPLSDETKNLLSFETIAKCKDGVKLINCARGGIIEEAALIEALNSGKVSAAAFDVYTSEPPDFGGPLIQHPKVVTTPHLGASTDEAQEKVAIQIAEQIVDLFNQKGVRGAVNAAAIEAGGNKELSPYVQLAENLGSLHSQLNKGQLKKININYSGEMLHNATTLLSTAVLKGFLAKKLTAGVNLINAPFFAKEMGIVLNETKSGANVDYTNLMTVEFITDKEQRTIAGTVFGNKESRIVSIDKYHMELNPDGCMLFYYNLDTPGMLASVGKILAEANINIAGLSLGRYEVGKEALTVINVDSEIPKDALKLILGVSGVHSVSAVKL